MLTLDGRNIGDSTAIIAALDRLEAELEANGGESFRAPLRERRGYIWVEEMFRRHRRPAAATTSVAATA